MADPVVNVGASDATLVVPGRGGNIVEYHTKRRNTCGVCVSAEKTCNSCCFPPNNPNNPNKPNKSMIVLKGVNNRTNIAVVESGIHGPVCALEWIPRVSAVAWDHRRILKNNDPTQRGGGWYGEG